MLDYYALGAVLERLDQCTAVYKVGCSAGELGKGCTGVWAMVETCLNLIEHLIFAYSSSHWDLCSCFWVGVLDSRGFRIAGFDGKGRSC